MPRSLLCLAILTCAFASITEAVGDVDLTDYIAGTLSDPAIVESSGLACDGPGRFWTHNDAGNDARLFRLAADGATVTSALVDGVENQDWEDIAFYRSDGVERLVIADIGDNEGNRKEVRLHMLTPRSESDTAAFSVVKTYGIRYPGGARDSEALAIDSRSETAWILSKRTVPAELYTVALDRSTEAPVTAVFAGPLTTLPQPTAKDIALAPQRMDWFWQPTAMDFSPDGNRAAVLTYEAIYLYSRNSGETWTDAFSGKPARFAIGSGRNAEALCLSKDAVFWTTEGASAPLFRIPLNDPSWQSPEPP